LGFFIYKEISPEDAVAAEVQVPTSTPSKQTDATESAGTVDEENQNHQSSIKIIVRVREESTSH